MILSSAGGKFKKTYFTNSKGEFHQSFFHLPLPSAGMARLLALQKCNSDQNLIIFRSLSLTIIPSVLIE